MNPHAAITSNGNAEPPRSSPGATSSIVLCVVLCLELLLVATLWVVGVPAVGRVLHEFRTTLPWAVAMILAVPPATVLVGAVSLAAAAILKERFIPSWRLKLAMNLALVVLVALGSGLVCLALFVPLYALMQSV